MFLVSPRLSTNKAIFGIYSVCISVSVFLSYADLGFLSAGQKYAAEEFAKGNRELERRIIGFTGFILGLFVAILMLVFAFLAFSPQILIPSLEGNELSIASKLLFLVTVGTPITVITRVAEMIFSVRVEEFRAQRIFIASSIVKIASVFFFFNNSQYDIVGYFAFMQLVNLIAGVSAIAFANRLFQYDIKKLVRCFRFDKELFAKTKDLAFSSLFTTIAWVLYYECDAFVIGRILGADKIAFYAIGFTLMSFTRSLLGGLFSPFVSRFNHHIGINDSDGLKKNFIQVVSITLPIVVFGITAMVLLMKPLVYTWVGADYASSISLARWLVCCNIFAFITSPGSILLSALERVRTMYSLGAILPLVYWSGIGITYKYLGIEAFAIWKFFAFGITACVYWIVALKYLKISAWGFLKRYALPNLLPLLLLFTITITSSKKLPIQKGSSGLFLVLLVMTVSLFMSLVAVAVVNKEIRDMIISLWHRRKARVPR